MKSVDFLKTFVTMLGQSAKLRGIQTIAASVVSLVFLSQPISIFAATTPEACPPSFSSKYGCTKVTYSSSSGNANITDRWFKGSTGSGGAVKWRINWAKDWEFPSGSAVFKEIWGPGSWRTDSIYSPYFTIGSARTRIANSAVTFQFRYHTNDASGNFYWCSWIHQHYMINNTSNVIDGMPCSDFTGS